MLEKLYRNNDGQVAIARAFGNRWEVVWSNGSTTGAYTNNTTIEENLNSAIDQISRAYGEIVETSGYNK